MNTNKHLKLLLVILLPTLLGLINSTAAQTSFQGIGDLLGGSVRSVALAVSADGKTIVGYSSSSNGVEEAMLWTNGVMVGLGDLAGGNFGSYATAVSADGSVIAGTGSSANGNEGFRWESGTMTGLGTLAGYTLSGAQSVSRDGRVIAGLVDNGSLGTQPQAFRSENGIMAGLGDLPGGFFNSASSGISGNGAVVVGRGWTDVSEHYEAFRWEGGIMSGLGYLAGGRPFSQALAVSPDGRIIVGASSSTRSSQLIDHGEACRWDNGAISALGDLPGGAFDSVAWAVSDDGLVIVGYGTTDQGDAAFVWDATNGIRNLQQVLTNFCGLDLTGWTLNYAFGISADGTTIVGRGLHNGNTEGWVARIPRDVVLNGEKPTLEIQQSVTLSWPVCPAGYHVQASPSLTAPDWQNVAVPVSVVAGKNVATVLITPTQRFFRLVTP